MPVEIDELVIRAAVAPSDNAARLHSGSVDDDATLERLVAQCVAQVMEILRRQKER